MENYQIEDRIGKGGYGSVFRAHHEGLNIKVAIKFLDPELASDPVVRERFVREARILALIDHPNVVRVLDTGQRDKNSPFFVMEYIDGPTLFEVCREGPLNERDAIIIAVQIADALAELHSRGIIHRDIKSSNVKLRSNNRVKLLDLGIARTNLYSELTGTGVLLGTPAYLSPEQCNGVSATELSDIYSLGIVLFEMLTGSVPYKSETPLAVLKMHSDAPVPILPDHFSADVQLVLARSLAKLPSERYASAAEFADALRSLATGERVLQPKRTSAAEPDVTLGALEEYKVRVESKGSDEQPTEGAFFAGVRQSNEPDGPIPLNFQNSEPAVNPAPTKSQVSPSQIASSEGRIGEAEDESTVRDPLGRAQKLEPVSVRGSADFSAQGQNRANTGLMQANLQGTKIGNDTGYSTAAKVWIIVIMACVFFLVYNPLCSRGQTGDAGMGAGDEKRSMPYEDANVERK